ncbi:MAG TPA: rhodanese-like domain-containing protein [Candidatus Acidoferrum sp.]|nr:rhodanese-like domain-containing protein [Candidatus Acidoferrum sp.]
MSWFAWLIFGVALTAFLALKRLALVRPEVARDWLKKGARVIDVRSESEFQEKHLSGAINIPLHRLSDGLPRRAPDKEQPILLHCLSGGRSGIGQGIARRMGYRNAFNLGSYGRAERILTG